MNPVQALFQFEEGGYPPIIVQCTSNQKINVVIDSFKNKVNADKIKINFNDYIFYFDEKKMSLDSTIADFQNGSNSASRSLMLISVRKRSKFIKCPDCEGNTCFLKIENYGLKFYGCPNNHQPIKTFSQYEDSQKINFGEIKCDKCLKTRREVRQMFKCLTCTKENGLSFYICNECKIKPGEKNHITIDYDDKNYKCLDNHKYSAYCLFCNKDICQEDEKSHLNKKHDVIKFESIKPKIEVIKKDLGEIKTRIEKSRSHINQILKMIETASATLDNYYTICMDIIGKYESFNSELKNYHIINNINFIENSNKIVNEHLDKLLITDKTKKGYLDKCEKLLDIFYKERGNYTGSNNKENNITQNNEVGQNERNYNNPYINNYSKNGQGNK